VVLMQQAAVILFFLVLPQLEEETEEDFHSLPLQMVDLEEGVLILIRREAGQQVREIMVELEVLQPDNVEAAAVELVQQGRREQLLVQVRVATALLLQLLGLVSHTQVAAQEMDKHLPPLVDRVVAAQAILLPLMVLVERQILEAVAEQVNNLLAQSQVGMVVLA
jgi:hypothetical protein